MPKKYHGVIPPIITPVDENENVDEKGFRQLLSHCADHGIHGMFVAGTNGETMALTQEQREKAIRIAIDEVGKRMPVMAGVMDSSTRRVIDNIKRLEQMGGTCAVITSIFYARHTSQDETVRHFERISRETNIDLVVYNIPPFTGLKLTAATMNRIAKIDKVVGIKDSSGDFAEFQKLLRDHAADPELSVLQGATPAAAASFLQGADGYVPSIAPLFPELFVQMYEAGTRGDIKRTVELNTLVAETSEILGMSKNATAANKFALSLLGFTNKRVIWPQDETTPEDEKAISAKVKTISEKLRALSVLTK
ncbi:MAG: dihydrodipicolinate synthase family protein [Spirochaetales bacterium]|nr:dihydrodipicolinate synthase family protein [Spirochaetales bacterium]